LPRQATLRFAFTAFTIAQLVSIFGDRLHQFSVVGMIGRVAPGSAVDLFLFALFGHLPILLFAPLLGTVVDRTNRALVLVVVDVFRGALAAIIPWLYHRMGNLYAFYFPVFFLSFANLLFAPAKSAAIPQYFGRLKLLRINAILWGLGIVGTIGGFVVGGWLFDYHSWELGFYSDAASYFVSVTLLLPLLGLSRRPRHRAHAKPDNATDDSHGYRPGGKSGVGTAFREALGLIRKDRWIAYGLITQTCLLGVFGVLYVVGISRIQEVLPAGKAMYLSAVATAGTLGLLAGSVSATLIHGRMTVNRVVSLSTVALGLSLAGLSQARSLVPLMAWTFAMGLAFSPIMVVTETMLQIHIPDVYRGRVFAVREVGVKISFLAMSFLGTLSTAVADKPLVLFGTGVFLAAAGIWLERKGCLRI
jgi:MFS family permease